MKGNNSGFVIDFFELMFLAESVIPEGPIARSSCFDSFSETHYHNMRNDERLQFFNYVKKQHGFTLENEQCRHFYARFNPKNQFLAHCFYQGKGQVVECYLFNGEYRTSINREIKREYIKKVIRVHDSLEMELK